MTVFRRGLRTPTQSAPTHLPLGHLVVTIDDLRALLQLLTADGPTKANSAPITVDFGGGYFDDPEDLRELSDRELHSLKILTSDVEVQLSSEAAVAIGQADVCCAIDNKWARQRQTTDLPSTVGRRFVRKSTSATVVLSLLILAICIFGIPAFDLLTWHPEVLSPILTAVAAVVIIGNLIFVSKTRWPPTSYAIIDPVTLEERRKERVAKNRHLQTAVIALAGVVVALIAVIVTILVA